MIYINFIYLYIYIYKMKDWISLLIAFVLGFFMKHLLGTVCGNRLVEGEDDNCPFDEIPQEWKLYTDKKKFNNLSSTNKCLAIKKYNSLIL
jgi:hypothetical protein